MAATTVRVLAYGCEHAPFTPKRHIEWLLARIEEWKPQIVVHLGDRLEAVGGSVHDNNEFDHDQRDEFEAAAETSERVRKACHKDTQFVWMLGNHDDNLQRADARRVPKRLRSLVHWNLSEWGPEFLRWKQVPYIKSASGTYSVGQIVFTHGYDAGVNSGETEALQTNNMTGEFAHRLFVRAHTHRPEQVTRCLRTKKIPLPWYYANVGTIGPLKPEWAARLDTSQWQPAVLLAEAKHERLSRNHGKNWSAEVRMMPT
jgi:hypothetical protein